MHTAKSENVAHFLGVLVDEELRWKQQHALMVRRGQAWVTQFRRVTKVSDGMAAQHIRQLYKSKAVPRMLYVKHPRLTKHISPLHTLLHEFNLKPNQLETRKPVRFDAQWDPGLTTCIWNDDNTAVEACESDDTDLQFFTDGSGYKGGVGAWAVMYWDGEEVDVLRYRLGDTLHHEVYKGECVGLLLALHMLSEQDEFVNASRRLHHVFGDIPPVPRKDDDDDDE
ncbi:hypothetical protein K435DRAFT_793735 [Dendrothele bispora CBS 962.96]|uniref:RNase H type-1 domain-containing protein n=1 Tax=Dendrothele bispora (strain CBS 962.96) TaxID=1314807 RepID=A0A4S8ME72_DENBC|nr:hypothetical protein K435DRAFT_793735 [Dendrothele bispora CBS 962.96]